MKSAMKLLFRKEDWISDIFSLSKSVFNKDVYTLNVFVLINLFTTAAFFFSFELTVHYSNGSVECSFFIEFKVFWLLL